MSRHLLPWNLPGFKDTPIEGVYKGTCDTTLGQTFSGVVSPQ
jgi:hypothetical protein